MKNYFVIAASAIVVFTGCVSNKVYRRSQAETAALRADSAQLAGRNLTLEENIRMMQGNIDKSKSDIASLNRQIASLSNQNGQLGEQTANQQNKLNQSEAELRTQQQRLQQLQNLLSQQREQSMALKNKMAEALKGFNSNDLTVVQKNGKVYVSLSENLLFPSGSAEVNPKGKDALSKLAAVLNLNNDVAVNIEGHTDSIPIKGRYKDNWDLSTARANSIVRILTENYKVDPVRVEASGHSYFDPVDTNSTTDGRSRNRRTEIILSPKLEEMYKLLEGNSASN
ncbi:MAG: OmpA family protein [Ferruginibacter sp.]